jgi:hypothetical protein
MTVALAQDLQDPILRKTFDASNNQNVLVTPDKRLPSTMYFDQLSRNQPFRLQVPRLFPVVPPLL